MRQTCVIARSVRPVGGRPPRRRWEGQTRIHPAALNASCPHRSASTKPGGQKSGIEGWESRAEKGQEPVHSLRIFTPVLSQRRVPACRR